MQTPRYILISPCRNEEKYISQTIDSVVRQTLRPYLWVIVDDGSTDATPDILKSYALKHSFIRIIRRENRGFRSVGPGVIDVFYEGYNHIENIEFDYFCKLDMDLKLPLRYFEILCRKMKDNPRIGTCSGKPYYYDANLEDLISEKCGDENSVGMTKFYRRACFDQIGGFVRQVMWDGIDGHRCRMLGWIAVSWDEPDLRFIHLRAMGSSYKNILTGRKRHGFGQYFMGTGFTYLTISAIFRMTQPPLIIGGCAIWWGYVKSWLNSEPRLDDIDFRKFLKRYQWVCLFRGKKAATEMVNKKQLHVWGGG